MARDALRADDFGGLSFGPGAKPILKGDAKLEIVLPARRKGRKGAGARRGGGKPAVRGAAARQRPRDRPSGRRVAALRHLPTISTCARWRSFAPASLAAMAEVPGVGAPARALRAPLS
jgi:ATP-dependent DNA helicase RecQ